MLLVTTRGTGQWIVPKGWPMRGRSWPDSAAQEAWEEAGVRGVPGQRELGRFAHRKTNWLSGAISCTVAVYPLAVLEEANDWPEHGQRLRTWFDQSQAARMVRSRQLAALIVAIRPEDLSDLFTNS